MNPEENETVEEAAERNIRNQEWKIDVAREDAPGNAARLETLDAIALRHGTDKSSRWHNYCQVYENYFEPIRFGAIEFMEIGIDGGASIRTWLDYFPRAIIYAVDHNKIFCDNLLASCGGNLNRLVVMCGEASSVDFWESKFPAGLTVALDDAGHFSSQIITTFKCVWPMIRPGGWYIVEDLHGAGYDPALNRDGGPTAVEFFKSLLDDMNERGANWCGRPTTSDIEFMHFYKSLVIIKKRS